MGQKNNQKFADTWANQTNLGKQFGLSAIAMGKRLKELGLRGADGQPTDLKKRETSRRKPNVEA